MYSIVKIRTPMGILTAITSNRDKKIEEDGNLWEFSFERERV